MKESLLTVKELSFFLHVHPKTIYRWIKNGQIRHIKKRGLGIRFRKSKIDDWIESGQNEIYPVFDCFQKLEISLENYDKMLLKGRSALSKKSKRWNYGFGAVYSRKTKQGKDRWYIDYRNEEGKRIQKVIKSAQSRENAVIALQQTVLNVFSREHNISNQKKKIKFADFADKYLENYAKVNKKSWKTDEFYLKSIKGFFQNSYLYGITSQDLEKYKAFRLRQGVQPSTVNRCLAILRKMFNLAIDWGYLQATPLKGIKFFSEKDNLKERILTQNEEIRLIDASCEHLKSILIAALNTGMRRGEILNLKWSQIDFKARMIRIERTKSGNMRFIPINSPILHELINLKSRRNRNEYVFINPDTRKPFQSVKTAFIAACRRANIHGLRFHDLRHTFASRLVEKGVDIITVKELLGHSTVKITERYTHTQNEQKKKAVDSLERNQAESTEYQSNLLHICDMGEGPKKRKTPNYLFSAN